MSIPRRSFVIATISALSILAGATTSSTQAGATPACTPGDIVGNVTAGVPKHRANTIVFVKNAGLGTGSGTVKLDQKGLVFFPRVLPIQKGTTVEFVNSDPVAHNVFTPDGDKYDLGTWPKGDSRKRVFPAAGTFRQLCHVHDDMIAYIVSLDTKYFALSDKSGDFKIPALPPGKYTLSVWHEKLGANDVEVVVQSGKPTNVTIALDKKK